MIKLFQLVVICFLVKHNFADFLSELHVFYKEELLKHDENVSLNCIDKVFPKPSILLFIAKQSDPFEIVSIESVAIYDFSVNEDDQEKDLSSSNEQEPLVKVFRGILYPVRCNLKTQTKGEEVSNLFNVKLLLESMFGPNFQNLLFGTYLFVFTFPLYPSDKK